VGLILGVAGPVTVFLVRIFLSLGRELFITVVAIGRQVFLVPAVVALVAAHTEHLSELHITP